MKVVENSGPCISRAIKTDEDEYPNYERSAAHAWWCAMGDSFEEVGHTDDLEAAFQEYLLHNPEDIEYFAEKMHNALGETWYYCNHGYYEEGYNNLPDSLKDMLRNAAKSVLGL